MIESESELLNICMTPKTFYIHKWNCKCNSNSMFVYKLINIKKKSLQQTFQF